MEIPLRIHLFGEKPFETVISHPNIAKENLMVALALRLQRKLVYVLISFGCNDVLFDQLYDVYGG